MYAYVNTLIICFNPGSKSFKFWLAISMTVRGCQLQPCCQSTYFMLHHQFQWLYCSVYMLHTGPPLPDVLLAWPRHQGRELCFQHLLNIALCDGVHIFVAHGYALWKRFLHQTIIAYFLHFSITVQFTAEQWLPCHFPPHVLLAISVRYHCIQSGGTYFSKCLPKLLWGTIFRRGHFCVTMPCLYHLQWGFEEHITWGILRFMELGQQCLGWKCWGCH